MMLTRMREMLGMVVEVNTQAEMDDRMGWHH